MQSIKITILFFLFCLSMQGQSVGKIKGKALTAKGALESLAVSLLSSKDNSLVKTEITGVDGSFEFGNLQEGSYIVMFDNAGYEIYMSQSITLSQEQNEIVLPDILISVMATNKLDEVVVKNRKPLVEHKIDKTVVNVDAMISSGGSDAMEVLEKSPGIVVDSDGTITFKGKKGVAVFIDDKPSYLSGAELEAYLRSLPASTLDQIELMTNPPAKYDAAGGGGVINIITKKSKIKGFNGSVTSRVSHGKRGQARDGLNLNYTNNKIRLYGNVNYALQNSVNDLYIFRRYKNEDLSTKTLFDQNTMIYTKGNTGMGSIGMDYYVSDKTTFGANVNGFLKSTTSDKNGRSELTNAERVADSSIIADNFERNKFKSGGINLNFRHLLDTIGSRLTADADYLTYRTNINQDFKNSVYQPDNSLSSQDQLLGDLPSRINIYTFKTDYTQSFKGKSEFGAGYKVSYSKTDNIADYADVIGGMAIPNFDSSNHFKYDEVINAAYINYNYNFKRFGVQSGLRLENTTSKGNQLGNIVKPASTFKKNYTNLFPTFYLQYKLDSLSNNQIVFSYGKRISRPYYQDLNPFLSPLDKFTYYSGNPYLNPEFSHNLELSYSYKSYFSTAFSYSKIKDNINETIEIQDGIYYSRPGNIGKSDIVSINVNADIPFASWLSTNIYSELTHTAYKSQLYTENLNSSGTFWYISALNSFKFGNGWSAELGGNYITKTESSQFTTGARGGLNVGVQKKILNNKGTLKFIVNDIFYTNTNSGVINNLRLTDASYVNKADVRFAALTFTYSFGKTFETKDKHEETGSESEQNRVKN